MEDGMTVAALRTAIVTALESLEAGDQRAAVDTLLAVLEDAPTRARRLSCPRCRVTFCWPGELEHHALVMHDCEAEAA
jgi:hypothetical protein